MTNKIININSTKNIERLAREIYQNVWKGDMYGLSDQEIIDIIVRDIKEHFRIGQTK